MYMRLLCRTCMYIRNSLYYHTSNMLIFFACVYKYAMCCTTIRRPVYVREGLSYIRHVHVPCLCVYTFEVLCYHTASCVYVRVVGFLWVNMYKCMCAIRPVCIYVIVCIIIHLTCYFFVFVCIHMSSAVPPYGVLCVYVRDVGFL